MNLPKIKTKEVSAQYADDIPTFDCLWAFSNMLKDRGLEPIAGSFRVAPVRKTASLKGLNGGYKKITVKVKENNDG